MASDLQIQGIKLPSPVVGACPSEVFVDVVNVGPDPAPFPVPMAVCLDIQTSTDGPPAAHYLVETPIESPPILPGKVRTFAFTGVQFPCAPSASVTATADCTATVPNNARTLPSLVVPVPKIDAIPWLWTDLRLGLQDSTGFITWSPAALCPGATCIAEVSLRNAGCAAAPSSVTTLEILDGAGQSIASMKHNTPSVAPGLTTVFRFTTTLPAAVAGQSLTFRACADSTGVVTPQCDLVHACASRTLSLATAAAPSLTFAATASVFPGDPVPLTWRIQNVCSDLGKVTARISYQAVVIYTSPQINVGLQDGPKGADPTIGRSAIPLPFYRIGTSRLTLEITGAGTDPGPYTTTADVTVLAEPSAGTWAFTSPPPAAAPWRRPYSVAGTLTNPARAVMTPTSVVLNETSTVVAPVSRGAMPPFGSLAMSAVRTDVWPLIQTWSWLIPGVWVMTGPFSGTFTYTYTFAMADEFGNAYSASTSPGTVVVVSVSGVKLGLATTALVLTGIALALVITGFVALAGYITAVSAPVWFAAATIVFGIAAIFGAGALDPPVPNFDYRRVEPVLRPELPGVLAENPALAPLVPVFALLARISATEAAMSATEARLIAARIDREREAIDQQSAEYQQLRDSLLLAAGAIPLAVVEAVEAIREESSLRPATETRTLRRAAKTWTRGRLSAKDRRSLISNGLTPEQVRDIESALANPDFVVRPIDDLLSQLPQAVAQIASGIQDESDAVLHPPPA